MEIPSIFLMPVVPSNMTHSSLDNAYKSTIDSFTANDVEELQKILPKIKSSQIKLLLERDIALARSKLVTKTVNDKIIAKSKTCKKETRVIEEEVEVEVYDEDGYIENHIKGFKQKARGIKNTLPNCSYSKIKDALIRCQGHEGKALEAILDDKLPPRPEDMKTTKIKRKIQRTETVYVGKGDEKFLVDVTEEGNNNDENMNVRERIIKNMIDEEKENSKKLEREIDMYKKNNVSEKYLKNYISGVNDERGNRMYLPGEFDAMERNECRLFTFKPERTFSNEGNIILYA